MVAATATAAGQRCSPGVGRAHAGTSSDPFRFTDRSLPDPAADRPDLGGLDDLGRDDHVLIRTSALK
jgi:hypothetical protein